MNALKQFTVEKDEDSWRYRIQLEDDGGNLVQLSATFEDLDRIAAAIDVQMDAVIQAAVQLDGR
jgi:hypothetical protein